MKDDHLRVEAERMVDSLLSFRHSGTVMALVPPEAVMGVPLPLVRRDGGWDWLIPFFQEQSGEKILASVALVDGMQWSLNGWLSGRIWDGSCCDNPVRHPAGTVNDYFLALLTERDAVENVFRRTVEGVDLPCYQRLVRLAAAAQGIEGRWEEKTV